MPECHSNGRCQVWYNCSLYPDKKTCPYKVGREAKTDLLPCSLCGGNLHLYLTDDTLSRFCDGSPCWDGGATCESCGVGFSVGTFGAGIKAEVAEKIIIKKLNRRAT